MKNLIILILSIFLIQSTIAQTWQKLSAGAEFSMALKSEGTLWSWGFNGNGQLGLNTSNTSESLPKQVEGGDAWADVSAGAFHCLALKKDGTLWAWGLNGSGQLGIGNLVQQNAPVQVGTDDDWAYIEAGQGHSFAIKEDRTLWAWGLNTFGQLGNNTDVDSNIPVQIGTDSDWWMIKAGGGHTLALKTDSTLWSWGANFNGQLGTANTTSSLVPVNVDANTRWADIDAGFEFSIGLDANGFVNTWGFNGNGQLGSGNTIDANSPQPLDFVVDTIQFIAVSAGSAFGFAMTENHELYAWGSNLYGELGVGNTIQQNNAIKVGTDDDWQMIATAEGGAITSVFGLHTLGLKASEEDICVTGANYIGQLGNGSMTDESSFSCVVGGGLVSIEKTFEKTHDIQLYPNPSFNSVFIKVSDFQNQIIRFSGLDGKLLYQQKLNGVTTEISLSKIKTKGIIFYQIWNDEMEFIKSGKLLLN